MTKRLDPQIRTENLLCAGIEVARTLGFHMINSENIGAHAQVSGARVRQLLGNKTEMRRNLVRRMIKTGELKLLGQVLALGGGIGDYAREKTDPQMQAAALGAL